MGFGDRGQALGIVRVEPDHQAGPANRIGHGGDVIAAQRERQIADHQFGRRHPFGSAYRGHGVRLRRTGASLRRTGDQKRHKKTETNNAHGACVPQGGPNPNQNAPYLCIAPLPLACIVRSGGAIMPGGDMVTKLLTMGMLAFLMAATAIAETRLALVIEQQDYSGALSDVTSAPQEADEIQAALQQTGFTVTRKTNLNRKALDWALSDFRAMLEQAGPDAVGFVYYTGHGAQHPRTGDSYLLGVNARLNSASDFAAYGLDMKSQRDGFAATGAKAVFLVFDACRNIPAVPGYKANTKGLNRVEARADMLIAYATSLGDVAEEGIYAPILAEELVRSGQSAETAFINAQRRVATQTGRTQLPWTNNLLYNEVCFAGCTRATPELKDLRNMSATETYFHSLSTPCEFRDFAAAYPTHSLTPIAKTRAEDCKDGKTRTEQAQMPAMFMTVGDTQAPASTHQPGDTIRDTLKDGTKGPEMVVVPAGSFMMGSPKSEEGRHNNEGPQRRVTIGQAFAVGKFEVSWAEWEKCVAAGACETDSDEGWGKGNRPVIYVGWRGAQAYAAWLSQQTGQTYRLLTEAEWEYAARARTTGRFSWGGNDPTCLRGASNGANFSSCTSDRTEAVGFSAPNRFGLHDMHGNVYEWVQDCYANRYSGAPDDGSASETRSCPTRVIRGGSLFSEPQDLRSANRNGIPSDFGASELGFRLARTLSD